MAVTILIMNTSSKNRTSRRDFLKASALVGSALAAPSVLTSRAAEEAPATSQAGLERSGTIVEAAPNDALLRVGLIGCGGRGSGAASQALSADPNVTLTAMGDAFEDQLRKSLQNLQKEHPDKVKVAPEKCFVGLDAYQKVIDSGVDVVLLATPPGFRPVHLKAAVEAGKHIFCEKPMATDAPGVRSVLESVKKAKEKKVALVAGFCWRYETARREFYGRIHNGAIGDLRAIYATYYAGRVKPMPPASERPESMGDLEWQMRNWYNFTWLSGDGYVEQACHSVDKVVWGLKDVNPIKAVAVGGRQSPNNQGNIFDHMFVVYEFPDDVRAFVGQRQMGNTYTDNSDYLMGSAGFAKIQGWTGVFIKGKENWRYKGPKADMYQIEHNELFAGIRSGKLINDGEWMAHSTLVGIMGRMAAYTGQEITWEQAMNSQEKIVPDELDWKMKLPCPPMAMPGVTKLV
jgi:myo-inositol 2-dehydrogenase / D-chiro-inositol 1-dehydrogenase